MDGIYLRRNWGGEFENVAILVAIAVNEDGYREVLGAAEGMKEDKASWVSFFAVTVAYGLGASLYMMRYYSNIMTEGLAFSYDDILRELLVVYGVVMAVNLILTFVIQRKRYIRMMESVKQYDKNLFALKKYLDKEKELQ